MNRWNLIRGQLILDPEVLETIHHGKDARVAYNPALEAQLAKIYGRRRLCLKIFEQLPLEMRSLDSWHLFRWGSTPICEATVIQNVFALRGLAPRVFDVVLLNGTAIAQVVKYIPPRKYTPRVRAALQIAKQFGIARHETAGGDALAGFKKPHHWVGNQLVDFGRFYFENPKAVEKPLRKHIYRYHKKPHREQIAYQECPDLGIRGRRVIKERLTQIGADDVDWTGATVLDIGCNHGEITRQVSRRGVKRAIGLDHKYIEGNRDLANWLGDWNVDYKKASLPGDWGKLPALTGIKQFDYVLCLSVIGHAGGYPAGRKYLKALVGKVMFFSGQGKEPREKYDKLLREDYRRVTWLGWVTDNGRHPLWRCEP